MKKQNIQSTKYWTIQQFLGITVFDSKSLNCGKIKSLYIDSQTFSMSGIIVKKRWSKEYFLSRDYFDHLDESGLYLNTIPIKPHDKVVGTDGKNIGKIIKINLNSDTNKLESLEIRSGFKTRIISSDKIVGIGEKITIKS
ncbi:MAG TPA: PRC-barrel domain-containing protein [Nitrosopumilus sp.]|nr:PRC-barrel domain-containing protein [Thermoproteota archaeon]HJJ23410.1 PRC-barrel domain-containing protein [Nitrosopumilus sp.]